MDDASHSHTQLSLARAALRVVPIPVCSYRSRPARLARLSPHAGEAPRCSLVQNGQFYLLNCTLMEASMSVPTASPLLPSTTERVPQQTDPAINEHITQQTEANVEAYSADRRLIDVRLEELDGEWDIERILEANAAAVSLIGLTLTLCEPTVVLTSSCRCHLFAPARRAGMVSARALVPSSRDSHPA